MATMQDEYQSQIDTLTEKNEEMTLTMESIEESNRNMERQAFQDRRQREKAERDFNNLRENIEAEVRLRKQFEEKVSYNEMRFYS